MRGRNAALALGVILTLGACNKGEEATTPDAAPEERLTNVRVEAVTPESFTRTAIYTGETAPVKVVTISAETGGKIIELQPNENDAVEAGDAIARIDTRLVGHQIEQARANRRAAEDRVKRLTGLVQAELAAPQDLEQAEAVLKAAKASLSLSTTQKGMAAISSPLSGIVTKRHREPGEHVGPGAPLVEVANLFQLEVIIDVPEDHVRFIKDGGEVRLSLPALPDLPPINGKVHQTGFVANTRNRTYPVKIRIDNPDLAIRAGMLARVTVTQLDVDDAVVVSRDTIVDGRTGKVVYVVEDGVAKERPIVLGPDSEARVLVAAGLAPGEQVIVQGQRQVVDGQKVRVVEPEPVRSAAATPEGAAAP
jgi:membrane fusion protein (multidrug efflux system)